MTHVNGTLAPERYKNPGTERLNSIRVETGVWFKAQEIP